MWPLRCIQDDSFLLLLLYGTRALYSGIHFARVATCGHWDAYRKIPSFSCCFPSFSCCLVAHDLCTAFLSFPLWQQVGTEMHTERFTPSPAAYRHGTRSSYNQLLLYSCVCVWTQRFGEDSSILFSFLIVRSLIWVLCSRAISFSVICNSVFLLTKNVNRDPQQTPSTDCVCSCCLHSLFSGRQRSRVTRLQSHSLIWIWLSDALRQQKPYGLLGTAEKEDWEPRSTTLFTQLWVLI